MTGGTRLARTRAVLAAGALVAALLWGAASFALAAAGTMLLLPGSRGAAGALLLAAGPAGLVALLAAMRAFRGVVSRTEVALWVEERTPDLRYALVTLAGRAPLAGPVAAALETAVAASTWRRAVLAGIARAVLVPLALFLAALLALRSVSRGSAAPLPARVPVGAGATDAAAPGGTLRSLTVRVAPPAYSRRRSFALDDPASIGALVGSSVVVEGRLGAAPVSGFVSGDTVRSAAGGARWSLAFTMPDSAQALRLVSAGAERLILLEPAPDSIPRVGLTLPARDSVLREGRGRIAVRAEVSDDIGLEASWFELIVSSGERESFTFRTAAWGSLAHAGARRGVRAVELSLDTMGLVPGDVLSLRVVARDVNSVTGPGVGVSETRTFRLARRGEYDSLAIEGLPPVMGDTAALGQRMLILLAEALERRRPRLERDSVVAESRRIAVDQVRLRRRVSDVIFMRLSPEPSGEEVEGPDAADRLTPEAVLAAAESVASIQADAPLDFEEDESPVVAVNRPLLEAYNAMWEASRELEIGEPDDALPHMRAALAAIQRARQAERLYLRGRTAPVVVDLAHVRLAGDRSGAAGSRRAPGSALSGERAAMAARYARALQRLASEPAAAIDSLLLLRLEALGTAPRFASALGPAIEALRRGADASAELLRARAALAGASRSLGPLPLWSVAW